MFYVQVLIGMAVVLVTVLVAGGRGDSLGPLPEDSAPRLLPGDRPVVAGDVAELRLGTGLRGYRMAEVDDVLDRLAGELERRDAELAELRGEPEPEASA